MLIPKCAAAIAFSAVFGVGAANAAPCTVGTCDVEGGPLGVMAVGIEDENVTEGAYFGEGSFSVANVLPAQGVVDVVFDGESGLVPSGFEDFTISFEQDGMDLGEFIVTDGNGFQILDAFLLNIASTSDIFFEITAFAFNDGVTLPDYNIRLNAVPVPAALPLLASGLAGLFFASRRRKKDA